VCVMHPLSLHPLSSGMVEVCLLGGQIKVCVFVLTCVCVCEGGGGDCVMCDAPCKLSVGESVCVPGREADQGVYADVCECVHTCF
jgi:hypothetical protein